MKGEYSTDRAFSEQFSPEIMRIVQPLLPKPIVAPASITLDRNHATDFVVINAGPTKIASRVRRREYFRMPYRVQFTIRSLRLNGVETELAKVEKGFADWAFYGFEDMPRKLAQWAALDLNVFRQEWLNNREAVRFEIKDNGDGTAFHSFEIRSFPANFVIASEGGLTDLLAFNGELYIDRDLPKPSEEEEVRQIRVPYAQRGRPSHTSIKEPFEIWFAKVAPQ
jgi:hypothetical protein